MASKTKELTPAQAAEQWKEEKRLYDTAKSRLETAAAILKAHFAKTGKQEYRGVGYSKVVQQRLDTSKVKAELGDRLSDFQKPVTIETLSLLEG